MENKVEIFYEIKLQAETYYIITANTAFYQFLGDRLYASFKMLLKENDKELLEGYIQERRYGEIFVLHVADVEGKYHELVSCIKECDESGNAILEMTKIDSLYCENNLLKAELENYVALLSQFNSVYFIYDREKDNITCFQFRPDKQILAVVSLDMAYEKLQVDFDESEKRKLDTLVSDLRNGIRSFNYYVKGNGIIYKDSKKGAEVCGTAIYHNGVHLKTIGNVSRPGVNVIRESVRRDQLTGLILKEDITNMAKKQINVLKRGTAIAIIDIDEFKSVNDNYGHMKGDEVLRKCASIIHNEVEGLGSAGRIGGDEFFIVLDRMDDKEDLRSLLRSIKNNILNAYTVEKDGFSISTSIGCATYPDAVDNFDDLFTLADYLLYRAKNKGKNRYIMYTPEKHGTVDEILREGIDNIGISSRKGLNKSDVVCRIADEVLSTGEYQVENIFNDIVDYFGVERIVLYAKDKKQILFQCGNKLMTEEQKEGTCDYIVDESLQKMYDKGVLIVNNIKKVENISRNVYEKLNKQGVLSFMHHEVIGKNGEKYVVSYESVVIRTTWNAEDMHFFRLFDYILSKCL